MERVLWLLLAVLAACGKSSAAWAAEPLPGSEVVRSLLPWHAPPPWAHTDPNDPARHLGRGEPLEGTSWRNRPFHVGWLVGPVWGDALIDERVEQQQGLLGGYRAGWDLDHFWGSEIRWAFAHLDADLVQPAPRDGSSRHWLGDAHLLCYPWGDARWRPFFSLGLGLGHFELWDDDRQPVGETLLTLPIGTGVKYQFRRWLALRVTLMDHFAVSGSELDSMHNVSLTIGAEARWGPPPRKYFPY